MRSPKFVTPGDLVGVSEEYIAGDGTYVDRGDIYSLLVGIADINEEKNLVQVIPYKDIPIPGNGDIVIGRVTDLKEYIALVDVLRVKGKEDREIAKTCQGAIHISNIKEEYVYGLEHEFGYQDIIKAKVIDSESMRLSTSDDDLGVVKAACSKCRFALERKNHALTCPNCGNIEIRKISSDYGKGLI